MTVAMKWYTVEWFQPGAMTKRGMLPGRWITAQGFKGKGMVRGQLQSLRQEGKDMPTVRVLEDARQDDGLQLVKDVTTQFLD